MSNTTAPPFRPTSGGSHTHTGTIRRTPFYFESQGESLFAWLHRRERAPRGDHGVLLCPPVGHEQVHAHRGLRHLADDLAAAGFAVLRFDYHGTGDSGGSGDEADRVATWLANIRDARSWLENNLGCRRLTLVGLRLGAVLAAEAAAIQAVDGLVLWAPVVKGRAYVREMTLLSRTAADGANAATDDLEAAGFTLTEQTTQELSRLDLLECRPRCRRALVVAPDDVPTDDRLLAHLRALGTDAETTGQADYADMMAEPHLNKVPATTITHIVEWLRAAGDERDKRARANMHQLQVSGVSLHAGQGLRERPLTISRQPHLFGILTERFDAAAADRPCVVLLNAGSAHRVGPHRLYVALARQLAARGFRCLRMDLCGLGDSLSLHSAHENDPYPPTALRDVALTLQYLRAELGVRQVVLMGLCSGAYTAFQAAAQLLDPMLVESVLINPLTFFWADGMTLDAPPAIRLKSFQDCVTSAWQPEKWLKLLSGRSKLGVTGALKVLVERWKLRKPSGRAGELVDCAPPADGFPSHPLADDLPGDLGRIARAGRRLAFFFARSDPGHGILTLHAARQVDELCRGGHLSVHLLDDADHTFSRRGPRVALGQAITDYLSRRYEGRLPPTQ